ncbi:MAG: LysR family transcriptional regulator [Trichocoleus desertorum ATA4-8-CV12]|nr:LysR family transcriptional regulator [Trichocoleus desertorum ATA4-8-CV12]
MLTLSLRRGESIQIRSSKHNFDDLFCNIHFVNNQVIDLNKLRVFKAVWEQRNVSRAAEALGVSQPTVSHALRDLRQHYGDRIFVRCPGGVMPTPLGEEIARRIGQALAILEQGLDVKGSFDQGVSRREFTLVMTDIAEAIILPRIVSHCLTTAPGIAFRAIQLPTESIVSALRDGAADAAIGFSPALRASLLHGALFASEYVTIASASHPRIKTKLSRDDFVRERHAVAQAQGTGHHAVEAALQRMGLLDNVGARVPHFLALPAIIAASDMVATIPRPLAELMLPIADVKIYPTPIRLPKLLIEHFWHERYHDDQASRWLRDLLPRAMQDVFAHGPKGFHQTAR